MVDGRNKIAKYVIILNYGEVMKKLHKFLKKSGLNFGDGYQPFLWKCFGDHRVSSDLIYENQDPIDSAIGIVHSIEGPQRIFEITVMYNDVNFIYVEPTLIGCYFDEAEQKNIDLFGTADVFELDDYIKNEYVTYDEILDIIEHREFNEYYYPRDDVKLHDEVLAEDWPLPVEENDDNKSFEVVISLDLTYNVSAASHKQSLYKAKCMLINQLDIQPNNFQVTNERVILNNGEV